MISSTTDIGRSTRSRPDTTMRSVDATIAGVRISHPDRIVYPDIVVTKLDVAKYFESIGEWIVPHVEGRPLTLVLCSNGMSGPCAFLKHSKVWGPSVIRRVRIQEKTKIGEYMVADSVAAVVALIQMGVLEIHTWNSTIDKVEKPNRIVIDLDPGEKVSWSSIIAAARLVKKVLEALDLVSFVKTTGGRGLHVVAPIAPGADWAKCLELTRGIAESIERSDPETFTTKFAKSGRESKILIDYLRNNRTNTSISAYSTRARDGATVSVPITWNELRPKLDPESFTIKNVPRRLERLPADPWKDYWRTRQKVSASMIKAVRTNPR
jgi:bifunctional non-homologous end joining protein LigD